jgi:hypothetical protein
MSDVNEEQAKTGDSDSVADDAIEAAVLDECLDESLRDRLEILVKNEGPEVSDCENNRILLEKGLAAEVSMPSAPPDWTPPIPKTEKGEPTFESVDNQLKCPKFVGWFLFHDISALLQLSGFLRVFMIERESRFVIFSKKARCFSGDLKPRYCSQIPGFFPGISLFHVGVLPRSLVIAVRPSVLDGFEQVILFWKAGSKIYNPIKLV